MRKIAIFTCPDPDCGHLDKEVDYNVAVSSSEYGTISISPPENEEALAAHHIDYDYSDSGDTDWEGAPTYNCRDCGYEMERSELLGAFIVRTLSDEQYSEHNAGRLSLEDIKNFNSPTTKKKIVKTTRKPASGAEDAVFNRASNELTVGFENYAMECPECEEIFPTEAGARKTLTCPYCFHSFTITNLIEKLCYGSKNSKNKRKKASV